MNIYDKSGWLFQGDVSHGHKITEADIDRFLELAGIDEYSRAVTPQIRKAGNRLSGLAETAYVSLLA